MKSRAAVGDYYKSYSAKLDCKLDEVDDPILEEVKKKLKDIDACKGSYAAPGFNMKTKQLLPSTIEWEIKGLPSLNLCSVDISKVSKSSYIIFAADIVAYTLHPHLKKYVVNHGFGQLNQASAIQGSKFEEFIIPAPENDFSDVIYKTHSRGISVSDTSSTVK